eukprot:scaffold22738_cov31-Tisochrysis_lutea.AAC.9
MNAIDLPSEYLRQGIRQSAVGQHFAGAVPSLLPFDADSLVNFKTVVRRRAQGPTHEYRSIEQDKHADIAEVVEDRHLDVAHRRVDKQHGHAPQFGDEGAKNQGVAYEEVPELHCARGVQVAVATSRPDVD